VKETRYLKNPPMEVGYDGGNVRNYNEARTSLMVPKMEDELVTKWRANILNRFGKFRTGDGSDTGVDGIDLFWNDLKENRSMKCQAMGTTGTMMETIVFESTKHFENAARNNLRDKVFFAETKTVCQTGENFPSIDFAGPDLQVYHVTINEEFKLDARGMQEVLLASKLLQQSNDGTLSMTHAEGVRLKLYWVVPTEMGNLWCNKKPSELVIEGKLLGPKTKNLDNLQIVQECCAKYVDHLVLVMEP
jgi:hypothetical protein